MTCAFGLQFLFYHPPTFQQLHGGKRTVMEEVKRIDFIGAFLMATGLTLFLLGISWGQSSHMVDVAFQLTFFKVAHRRHGLQLAFFPLLSLVDVY